jgi:hypothetical protein
MSAHVTARSSAGDAGFVHIGTVGVEVASPNTPMSLWPGAGERHVRKPLLRAHPLLDGSSIAGPIFGRRVAFATVEVRRWMERPLFSSLGLAMFVDAAHASQRLPAASGDPFQVDAGLGLRIRFPGRDGMLRIDYARGVFNRAGAISAGWQF